MYWVIAKSLLFILNKWDLSMDDLNLLGKIVLYIPIRINNVLTQLFYFSLFPFVCLYMLMEDKLKPYILFYQMFLFTLRF